MIIDWLVSWIVKLSLCISSFVRNGIFLNHYMINVSSISSFPLNAPPDLCMDTISCWQSSTCLFLSPISDTHLSAHVSLSKWKYWVHGYSLNISSNESNIWGDDVLKRIVFTRLADFRPIVSLGKVLNLNFELFRENIKRYWHIFISQYWEIKYFLKVLKVCLTLCCQCCIYWWSSTISC